MTPDAHVSHHRVLDLAVLSDQKRDSPYADAEWTIDVVHPDRYFLRIAEQGKRQVMRFAKA